MSCPLPRYKGQEVPSIPPLSTVPPESPQYNTSAEVYYTTGANGKMIGTIRTDVERVTSPSEETLQVLILDALAPYHILPLH